MRWTIASFVVASVIAGVGAGAPSADAPWGVQMSIDGPMSAVAGQPYTYVVTLANTGAATTAWLQIRPDIVIGVQPSQGTCSSVEEDVTQCTLGQLAAGATATVAVTTSSPAPVTHDLLAAPTASANPHVEINWYSVDVTQPGDPRITDLRATVTGPTTAAEGSDVPFSITLRNADTQPATGVVLVAQANDYSEWFGSASSPEGSCGKANWEPIAASCSIGTLAPGATATMNVAFCSAGNEEPFGVNVHILEDWNGKQAQHLNLAEARTALTGDGSAYCPENPPNPGGGGGGGGQPPTSIADVGPPTIAGSPSVGSTLTASPGIWVPDWSYSYDYRWYTCNVPAPQGPGGCGISLPQNQGPTYVDKPDDAGCTIRVGVIASDPVATSFLAYSSLTAVVPGGPCRLTAPVPVGGGGPGGGGNTAGNPPGSVTGATGPNGSTQPASTPPCAAGYTPCLRAFTKLSCADVPPAKRPVRVTGKDPYRLDRDHDGIACDPPGTTGGKDSPYGVVIHASSAREPLSARPGQRLTIVGWSPRSVRGKHFSLCVRKVGGYRCAMVRGKLLTGRVQTLAHWNLTAQDRVAHRFGVALMVGGKIRAVDTVKMT